MPAHIPKVAEVGATSAPLKSAAFFIGAYCKEYNGSSTNLSLVREAEIWDALEDFILCKAEDRNPEHCLKEGRRVTRCATDLCETYVLAYKSKQFQAHWNCLEKNNQEYYLCRKPERSLNACMFEKLGLTKTIPGTPEGQVPIHEVKNPYYKSIQK
ncbi:hypothetical protein C0995_009166 [Termitomyces sp. Mi166|nr:hypothetical protein C0995_009166 [Termitomyces sp. Mi166\